MRAKGRCIRCGRPIWGETAHGTDPRHGPGMLHPKCKAEIERAIARIHKPGEEPIG